MGVQEVSPGYAFIAENPAVPVGYKQSEVGVIPEDWSILKLSSIADVRDGTHESPKYVSNGVPFVTSKNILSGRIDFSDVSYITHKDALEIDRRSKVDRNDILISMIGTVGNAALVNLEPNFSIKNVGLIKPDTNVCSPSYITHYFHSATFKTYLDNRLAGGIQKFVSLGMLRNISIPAPSLEEQYTIATALSDVDALLEELDRLIAKKRDIKQAAMQQLLTGETRLPGFEGGWVARRIGDVLEVRHGRSQKEVETKDGEYPIYASGGEIGRADTYLYSKPSVLIGRKGTIDAPRYCDQPFWTVDTLFYTELLDRNSAKFMYYKFCMIPWRNYNEASGVPSLSARTIENIEIVLPTHEEQEAIAAVLSDMDTEIQAIEQRRSKTAELKQGMMQELLTGRTRLV